MKRWSLMAALVLICAAPAIAQIQSGTISGIVSDEQGGVLPGVNVTVQGVDAATPTSRSTACGSSPMTGS